MRKISKFTLGMIGYIAVLVVLIIILLVYTHSSMKKYEAAQPDNVMNKLVTELKEGKIPEITTQSGSKFEDVNSIVLEMFEGLDNSEITYDIKSTSYDTTSYNLKADGEKIATVNLKASNHEKMFFLLTICDWKVDSIEAVAQSGTGELTVTVPTGYTVLVNNIILGEEEMEGEPQELPGLSYVKEYTEVPTLVTYHVEGLINEPEIIILDDNNNQCDLSGYEDKTKIDMSYKSEPMPQELQDYVVQAAKDYSNFFSKDLPGCSQSTAGIDKYFPTGSMYIELAENYRRHDMWMYSAHHGTEIFNVVVDDYIVYSDELFSCHVSFDKRMILTSYNQERMDRMDQIFYYVNIDGQWLIAAMVDNVE